MTEQDQKDFILNFIQGWVDSKQDALMWYESEVIHTLNKTAQQVINTDDFEAVKTYLEHIKQGAFA